MKIDRALAPVGTLVTFSDRFVEDENPLGILSKAAVLIKGDEIVWVGKQDDVPPEFDLSEADIQDLSEDTVFPGFIDAHTHLVFAGSRANEFDMRVRGASYLEILQAGGGINATVRMTREASFDELYDLGMRRLDAMLREGVTTVEAKSGYGLTLEGELRLLEVIQALNRDHVVDVVPTFLGAHTIPEAFKTNPRGYVDLVIHEMLPAVAERNLAEFCDVFCEEGVYDIETSREILEAAREKGLKLKIHADQLTALGGGRLAAELGATSAEHLEYLREEDIPAFKEAGTVAVLLPVAAMYLMMEKTPPVKSLLKQGAPVAFATDFNPGSAPCLSLLTTMTMAAILYHLPSDEVLRGVTVHAARAVGRETKLGKVEAGFQADLAVFPVRDHRLVATTFGGVLPSRVMKGGKWASLSFPCEPIMTAL